MRKTAQHCDLKLGYAGAVFWIEAHSPAGREWLDQAIEGSRPSAAQRCGCRWAMLDEVLRMANRARLRLDVPW
jgi:hypothetical protein